MNQRFAQASAFTALRYSLSSCAALLHDESMSHVHTSLKTQFNAELLLICRIPLWEQKWGIKVIRVLSKRGEGYVQDVLEAGEPIENGSKTCVLLCGQKEMAMAVKEVLMPQGVPEDRFLTNF
jgi:NAD(P)H-flavin reductase